MRAFVNGNPLPSAYRKAIWTSPGSTSRSQRRRLSASSGTVRSGRASKDSLRRGSSAKAWRNIPLMVSALCAEYSVKRIKLTNTSKKSTRLRCKSVSALSTMCRAANCRSPSPSFGPVDESLPCPFVRRDGVVATKADWLTAWKLSAARRGRTRRIRPWARESWCVLPLVSACLPEMRSRSKRYIVLSPNIRRHSLPCPGLLRKTSAVLSSACDGGGGGGSSQSISSRSPRTFPPFVPTSTCGAASQRRIKAATRDVIRDRMATSPGLAAALWITVMARMLAAGAGESRAWIRDSSDARDRTWVKDTGPRSLMVRLAITAGSCVYCLRMVVSLGRNLPMRGGMLVSIRVCRCVSRS